jgi:CheY-like chemotaxis protein
VDATPLLLAEDEQLIALTLQEALEEGGYVVRHVLSGEDALRVIETGEPALAGLITDIRLVGEPDGWALARRARELTPSLPVVYMSGDSGHEHAAYGVPGSVMLHKPFASAQLVTAISALLNAAPSTA